MAFDPQTITAVAISAAATVYLGRRSWNLFAKHSGGCGSCSSGGCASGQTQELLEMQAPQPSRQE